MHFKRWDSFIREIEMPEIESLPKEELIEMVYKYEQALSSIVNIDTQFITEEGDCDYTDQEALERIMEIAFPIWESIANRKRDNR